MYHRIACLAAAGLATALSGCSSGVNASQPNVPHVDLGSLSKLQFAVGTFNLAGTATYLNTVATLRNSSGGTAFLVDTPTITGPFTNNGGSRAGVDAGTNKISGLPQVVGGPTNATFGQSGGLFGYGFANANSGTGASANYPQFAASGSGNTLLFNDDTSPFIDYVGTTPISAGLVADAIAGGAVTPQVLINSYPEPLLTGAAGRYPMLIGPGGAGIPSLPAGVPGFAGFPVGFTAFANIAPAASATPYSLSVQVASAQSPGTTFTASATMATLTTLGLMPEPTFTSNGAGGGTVVVAPTAGVTEAELFVVDVAIPGGTVSIFTFPFTGAQTITVPNMLQTNAKGQPAPSFSPGDAVFAYTVGFDYPAFEGTFSTSQTPSIVSAAGTADVTVSRVQEQNY